MKARIRQSDKTLIAEAVRDGYIQGIATTLYVLQMGYGFGEKRLNRIIEDINCMSRIRFGGHRVKVQDMERELKNKYGIDLYDKIKICIQVKEG